jgi:hypothetical protein
VFDIAIWEQCKSPTVFVAESSFTHASTVYGLLPSIADPAGKVTSTKLLAPPHGE